MSFVSSVSTRKTYFDGTHRVRHPEETWEVIRPKLDRFGITRIADITGLDIIGIPVLMAVRPLAKTLSVAQGKGRTPTLATVSAVMESIELWHAEYAVPPPRHRSTAGLELDLPYQLRVLATVPGALLTERTPLDWVDAIGMTSGQAAPLPAGLVRLTSPAEQQWRPLGLRAGSNGLASGNTLEEAALHALYEIIERDAVSRERDPDHRRYIEPATIHDIGCAELVDRIRFAGVALEVFCVDNRFGIPCFGAQVWSPDFPVLAHGWGAHLDPGVALSRAITEAVQSRLTAIAGSRDDLPPIYQQMQWASYEAPQPPQSPAAWSEITEHPGQDFVDIGEELTAVSGIVADVAGEALLVNLSSEDDFAVVRVVVPGAELDVDRFHAEERPGARAG